MSADLVSCVRLARLAQAACALSLTLPSCASATAAYATEGDEVTPSPSSQARAAQLTDGQTFALLATLDSAEVEQGHAAITKATSPAVREYASTLVEEHGKSKEHIAQLAAQAGLPLRDSSEARRLRERNADTMAMLLGADAAQFDAIYLKVQLQEHQTQLQLLDGQLQREALGATRDPVLRARSMTQHHLTLAQQIKGSLRR